MTAKKRKAPIHRTKQERLAAELAALHPVQRARVMLYAEHQAIRKLPIFVQRALVACFAKVENGDSIAIVPEDAPSTPDVRCNHRGIGQPGCETCDPRARPSPTVPAGLVVPLSPQAARLASTLQDLIRQADALLNRK